MSHAYSPITTAYQVTIDGLTLDVPSQDRCWKFPILYACRCPVTYNRAGIARNKIICVKQNNHGGSCTLRRCLRGTQNHFLPEQCIRCDIADARHAGVYVP
ncbi:hypothetical protein F4803DRAFT_509685 [Xylaria telfairii]|nr:hypothetical protein F4803DRAFT_509685 [Xylaria telfairii]